MSMLYITAVMGSVKHLERYSVSEAVGSLENVSGKRASCCEKTFFYNIIYSTVIIGLKVSVFYQSAFELSDPSNPSCLSDLF